MTEQEHDRISQLVAILLLGYLLPHSTGNEFFLLQHTPDNNATKNKDGNAMNGNETAVDYILHMDLEERLESTCRHYSAFEFGEFETLTDMTWEVAFDTFLREGLAPFLGGRPASLQQVDLLHILSMVVHPQPLSASTATAATTLIPETAVYLEDQRYWERARQLMSNRHAHSFHVNYEHRLKIIKLMVRNLVVPSYDAESPMVNCPLFDGALSHLRASLHAFSMGALSMEDAHWARSAVISITVQSRVGVFMKEEWNCLINRMVDDRTQYPGCKCCPQMLRAKPFGFFDKQSDQNGDDSSFCPHASRGLHLADFIMQICQSRHSPAGGDFLLEAFSSLLDAIEWQMHCWKKPSEAEEAEEPTPDVIEEPPCMLASLLFASKTFFYFLLPMEEHRVEDDPENIVIRRDELLSCAIQLVHHQDEIIASEAAELLAVAFAYASKQSISSHAKALFSSLQKILPSVCNDSEAHSSSTFQSSIQNIISAASRVSPAFATSILNLLLEYTEKTSEKPKSPQQMHFLLTVIASVAVSNPGAGEGKASSLVDLLGKLAGKPSQSQGIAALLACRQAYFFERKEGGVEPGILETAQQIDDRWTLYKLGRLALKTGNYATARLCYQRILQSALSERYFLWVSALSKITNAELCLSKYAAKGLPQATTELRSALSIFQSMKVVYLSQGSEFSFQICLITLRLDFLDLLTGLRQIIREMRLTGSGPAKRTRSFLHFQNIVRCFDALSRRYTALFRKHGLFICQQSRTTLKALHALCRFVARSVRVVFSDMLPPQKKEESWLGSGLSGDSSLPVARFMRCLDERLLQKMSPAVDPVIRAAAMIEVVDGIVLCPSPFPIDFLSVAALPRGRIQLSADPEESSDDGDADDVDADERRLDLAIVEGYPGISFDFCATGEIPVEFLGKSNLPFSTILLWHRAEFAGPLQEEDEAGPEEKQEDEHMVDEKQEDEAAPAATVTVPRPWGFKAVSTNLQPNGKFNFRVECPPIREEGNYEIIVKLGCRDIRGGEWEIPVEGGLTRIQVQVSRSNS